MKVAKECGSSEQASSVQKVYDINDVMDENSKNVTDHEKYVMFKDHFRPGENNEFKKKTLKYGCYRLCKREHLSECFAYSPKNGGVYCIFCSLFLTADRKRSLGSFVINGYRRLHDIKEKNCRHAGNSYHQQAVFET